MKGTNLGEFEELILLAVGIRFDHAYGVSIKNEIYEQTGRKVTLSTVHAALNRLQKKGYLNSRMGEASPERGGKRKKLFTLTAYGVKALESSRTIRNRLWDSIPSAAFNI